MAEEEGAGPGKASLVLLVLEENRAALTGKAERPAERLVENRSPIRGTFKFLLCESRYLRSVLTEEVFYE